MGGTLEVTTVDGEEPLSIRPLREEELDLLAERARCRPRGKHEERLEQQRRGEAIYFVAWLGGEPAGFLLLLKHGRAGYHEIQDVYVREALQGRGIGSALMNAAEAEVRRQGSSRVGLEIEFDNVRARTMYKARGYEDAGMAPTVASYTAWREDGTPYEVAKARTYLRKLLA